MIFLVASRKREIAIRIAIGAAPRNIWSLVLNDGLPPVAAGLAAGCVAGFALVRAAQSVLYEVSVRDPRLAVVAAIAVAMAGLAASLIPTLRALRVDPSRALREE
jgi:ABC-type antimicrobial peptide transport system permease subunit